MKSCQNSTAVRRPDRWRVYDWADSPSMSPSTRAITSALKVALNVLSNSLSIRSHAATQRRVSGIIVAGIGFAFTDMRWLRQRTVHFVTTTISRISSGCVIHTVVLRDHSADFF